MSVRMTSWLSLLSAVLLVGCQETPAPAFDASPSPLDATDATSDACPGDTCDATPTCTTGVYHPGLARCVGCVIDADCSGRGATGRCHPTAFQCVACFADAHCGDGVCDPDKSFCVECLADADCASKSCDRARSVCLGCASDVECDDKNPCTQDYCDRKVCRSTPTADGGPCTQPCLVGGACKSGLCAGAPDPVCATPSKCLTSADCLGTEWCDRATCEGQGACKPRPASCDAATPICGCDGVTYPGACEAHRAGTVTSHDGVCCLPKVCKTGTPIDIDADGCADACPCQIACDCEGEAACITLDEQPSGTCQPPSGICDADGVVCGCDGKAWPSECAARAAGVSVRASGCCVMAACPVGQSPTDLTGDGCADQCCPPYACPGGGVPVDTTGDGCFDGCQCTPPTCAEGHGNADLDHDGCRESCVACVPVSCPAGATAKDTDLDGCSDACVPLQCGPAASCPKGSVCQSLGPACGEGSCVPAPTDCASVANGTAKSAEVCGCDGQVHASACLAQQNGISVLSSGPCVVACDAGTPCASGHCDPVAGACSGAGVCVATPTTCAAVKQPVCGCDLKTYGNDCLRLAAKVGKAHDGACACKALAACPTGKLGKDTTGDGCPDVCEASACTTDAQCQSAALYCARPLGSCDGAGTCAERPKACLAVTEPVCGCDGATYTNACVARQAGVSLAPDSACVVKCSADAPCPKGQHCETAAGDCAGSGTCVSAIAACDAAFAPVCGCDGLTYANDCARQSAGIALLHTGACTCKGNAGCAETQWCEPTLGCAGLGVCLPKPSQCAKTFQQACGCDGKTYSSDCDASAAGVKVATVGLCK